jgi:hypothetical protein
MGMDLKPLNKRRCLKDEDNEPQYGRYNIWAWERLNHFCIEHNLPALPMWNDGDKITASQCKMIAKLLREPEKLEAFNIEWIRDDIEWWEKCGGCRVY